MCRKEIISILVAVCLIAVYADAALVAEFKFDGNLDDSSGNGYVCGGGLVGDTHYVAGKSGQALDFDGAGDFIQAMVAPDGAGGWTPQVLEGRTAFAIDMWIKMDAYPTADTDLLASREWFWGDMNLEFHTYFGLDKVFLINVQGAVPAENPLGLITPDKLGQWINILATYDSVAGEAYIYIDGVRGAKATIAPGRVVDIGNYTIGGNALLNGRYFDGQIDEVKIYDVPEPATMTLLALGMAAMMRRRKSN